MGIGAGFIPDALDVSVLDEVLPVTEQQAYAAMDALAHTEGILVGVSSGAAAHAARVDNHTAAVMRNAVMLSLYCLWASLGVSLAAMAVTLPSVFVLFYYTGKALRGQGGGGKRTDPLST